MRKRRQDRRRPRRASSAEIRFAALLVLVAGIVLTLASVLVGQLRAADWKGAAISGAVAVVLLAIAAYSVRQNRRG